MHQAFSILQLIGDQKKGSLYQKCRSKRILTHFKKYHSNLVINYKHREKNELLLIFIDLHGIFFPHIIPKLWICLIAKLVQNGLATLFERYMVWRGSKNKYPKKKFKRNWTTFSNMCVEHLCYETSTRITTF